MKLRRLLQSFFISLLFITTPVLAQCPNEKDCSAISSESLTGFFQATLCGLFNFLTCVSNAHLSTLFYGIVGILIVSFFGFVAYLLSINS